MYNMYVRREKRKNKVKQRQIDQETQTMAKAIKASIKNNKDNTIYQQRH